VEAVFPVWSVLRLHTRDLGSKSTQNQMQDSWTDWQTDFWSSDNFDFDFRVHIFW
jgi:hypothetical protein